MSAKPSPRTDLPTQLVTAAENLIAERGLDRVSLRDINAAAGARNTSALQYHFGDRAGLVRAVLAKHDAHVETRRHALLDQYDASDGDDVRTLVAALVRPLAAELTCDGGAGYLQLATDLLGAPQPVIDLTIFEDERHSIARWRTRIQPFLDPGALRRHRRFLAMRFTITELSRRARMRDRADHNLFISDLIDAVSGLVLAPESAETKRAATHKRARSS